MMDGLPDTVLSIHPCLGQAQGEHWLVGPVSSLQYSLYPYMVQRRNREQEMEHLILNICIITNITQGILILLPIL